MKILMFEVPTFEIEGSIPWGVLYAASSAIRNGHDVKIIDLVKENFSVEELNQTIESFSPAIIGLGGITSSYKNCKELIADLKGNFPLIPIVIGGVITSIYDLLLTRAGADYIVHGEGEITFPNLIKALEEQTDISRVKGISYMQEGIIETTEHQPQIDNLDKIPLPEYSLLNMDKYLELVQPWIKSYFESDKDDFDDISRKLAYSKYFFPLTTARGCTHTCIFCYRHQRGWRQHSVDYTINAMRYIKDRFDVGMFQIQDELTTGDKNWVTEFCEKLIKEDLGIYFIVLSSRVDNVDEEMLTKLKQAGCLMVNYGYESGSKTILKEIRKGVTREQALQAGLLTKKVGLKNVPEIIIGFPSETPETVEETIDFLKQLDVWPISVNTPIPFPKTYLWRYAIKNGLIKDEESFILNYKRHLFVNFTKYSDKQVDRFFYKVIYDTKSNWLKNRRKYLLYFRCIIERFLILNLRPLISENTYNAIRRIYRKVFRS